MAQPTQEALDLINQLSSSNGTDLSGLSSDQVSALLGYYSISNNALGNNNSTIAFLNTLLQQQNREVDYQRTLPANVVANLQAAGMSRAAALGAAAGVQPATTPVSPSAPANPDFSNLSHIASVAGTAVDIGAKIASLPYDMRVKQSTAELLSTQGTMLEEQRSGQLLATSAIQACSNLGFDFKGANATSIMEYMRGIPELGALVKNIQSNPYAFASLSQLSSQDYATRAQSFEPTYAEYRAQQQRSLAALTAVDENNAEFETTLLANQVYRDNIATALFQAVEYAKAQNYIKATDVDTARLDNILRHIKEFNEADLEILRFQLNEAKMYNDPAYREQKLQEITSSSRFQAAQAIYGYSLSEEMTKVFSSEMRDHPLDMHKSMKKYLYGVDLGGYQNSQNTRGWITAGGTAVGAMTALILGGMKIFGPKVVTPPMYQGWSPTYSAPTSSPYVFQ